MGILRPGTTQIKLPEIGRIFKGGPKRENPKNPSGANIMGVDLDHFRFEPAPSTYDLPSPDRTGSLADYLIRQYKELGDAPRALPIQFLHAEIEKDFFAINEVWAKIGGVERCVRRCDGQNQKLHLVESGGKKKLSNEPISCAATEGMNKCPLDCKPTGRLSFVMPCLNYPGLVIMTTHSIYDIIEIQGNLAMYSNWDINKIPFQLCRAERTINRPNDDGSKSPMKKWLCHLVIDPRFGNAVLAAQPKQYLAELTGGVEWEADYVDVTPVAEVPALMPESKPAKTGQQRIVARICAVAKEAGFTEDGRDALLNHQGIVSKNDITQARLDEVLSWLSSDIASGWNDFATQQTAATVV